MDVKRNLIANFAGRAWSALISFVFLPIYLKLLGVESYGLITIFISLNALIQILDFGLSTTINRELAKLTAMEGQEREARDLVRTLETVYWLIGVAIALGVIIAAPWAATHWVHTTNLSQPAVTQALTIMGLVCAFQWPDSLYAGALMGLQRQVSMNKIRIVVATVQYTGAALLLAFVSNTIQIFFLWQIIVYAVQTFTLRNAVWRFLPVHSDPTGFRKEIWVSNWRFAAGMTGISIMAAILTQLDKVVLSKMLPLEVLGYYGIATQLASIVLIVSGPVLTSVFPQFVNLSTRDDTVELASLYHKSCQLMAALVLPMGLTISLFASELLAAYMRDPTKVAQTHLLLSLIVLGTSLNTIMILPFSLQLAYGWTSLSFYKNIIAVLLFVPGLFFMTARYGPVGAALMWIILNAGYLIFEIPIMHRRLLHGEAVRYYLVDLGLPLMISAGLLLPARFLLPLGWPLPAKTALICFTCSLAILICLCLPLSLWQRLSEYKNYRQSPKSRVKGIL